MAIYIWHYPAFWAVARHTGDWSWPVRTAAGFAVTAVAVLVAQRVVEMPLQRWLSSRLTSAVPDRTSTGGAQAPPPSAALPVEGQDAHQEPPTAPSQRNGGD